jgi:hypothetical protein
MIKHIFSDITHFDGKFFSTSKYLLLKPGFLSLEYAKGKRVSYLNPVRMYLFTSALFFLIFFSMYKPDIITADKPKNYAKTKDLIEKKLASLQETSKAPTINRGVSKIVDEQIGYLTADLQRLKTDTTNLPQLNYYTKNLGLISNNYSTVEEYDSAQLKLPKAERDGWIARKFKLKMIYIEEKYGNDSQLLITTLTDKFLHKFPQMFFISLPFFALLLKLLYRRKKEYYYTEHFIYSLHFYCATFLFILIQMILSSIQEIHYLGWLKYIRIAFFIYMFYYLYRSMRTFYKAGKGKTILKYILLLLMTILLMSILFLSFFIFSVFTI